METIFPTQSLGMIPETRCANAPVLKTATQVLEEKLSERKHLVQSAKYWFDSAHDYNHGKADAVLAMDQAYNHVENALAAALSNLRQLMVEMDGPYPGDFWKQYAKCREFLNQFPNFKS